MIKKDFNKGKRIRSEKVMRALDEGMLTADGFNGVLYELSRACDDKAQELLHGHVDYETQREARRWQRRAGLLWDVMNEEEK